MKSRNTNYHVTKDELREDTWIMQLSYCEAIKKKRIIL